MQFVEREPGSYGRDCLTLQISDETGHMQALWTLSETRANQLIEQIGDGREAVVSGIVHEWPLGSGEMRMVLDDVDLEKVILAIIEPPLTETIDTLMQIVPKLERLPKPVASLVIDFLESPISMDHLHQVLVKMRRALDLNPDGPWYYVVCLAAVAVEISKLSTTVRARVVEELSHILKKMVDEYVLSREDADQVLNLVTRGFLSFENAQSASEFLVDQALIT